MQRQRTITLGRILCSKRLAQLATPATRRFFTSQPSALPHLNRRTSKYLSLTFVGLTSVATFALLHREPVHAEAPAPSSTSGREGGSGARYFRLAEVRNHGADAEEIWVMKGTAVYDITHWIAGHPGGDVILRAAGSSLDPFWKIFTFHNRDDVLDILEQYRIGSIDPRDLVNGQIPAEDIEDPFHDDPKRDPRLQALTIRPCNAETPASELSDFVTPNEVFFTRNHLWVPEKTESSHRLTIELPDGTEKSYTVDDLRSRFKEHTITAVLQCSGNRRSHMTAGARSTNGLQWGVGAIGNAEWTGVRLRDVLKDAGLPVDDLPSHAKHAQFTGSEAYGASIPIEKAVDPRGDVLLVYNMNGKPLPPDHGYPLRVLVPGHVAARSVKWVEKIAISEEESTSQWQRRDYKCFGPNQGNNPDWDKAKAIQELPVQSAVTCVKEFSTQSSDDRRLLRNYGLEEDFVSISGYAYSGGGREIQRVDISVDGGLTWRQAKLLEDESRGSKHWSWKRWTHLVPKGYVGKEIVVKAVDDAYNTQPESYEAIYNFRGNLTTAWHRVPQKH